MPEGIRHVERVMGTVFSFDIRTPRSPSVTAAVARAVAWLHHVDRVFSPYRPDSQVTRLADGRVGVGGCDPEVAEVLRLGAEFERVTGGAFTCEPGAGSTPAAWSRAGPSSGPRRSSTTPARTTTA